MFVSVILDLGNDDSRRSVNEMLMFYGFQQVQKDTYETAKMSEKRLGRLKLDLDRATDYYDVVRLYQYPVDGTLVITHLTQKKWKRKVFKA